MLQCHAESVQDCRKAIELDPLQLKVYSRASKGLLYVGGDVEAATQILRQGINVAKDKKTLWDSVDRFNDEVCINLY